MSLIARAWQRLQLCQRTARLELEIVSLQREIGDLRREADQAQQEIDALRRRISSGRDALDGP